MHILQFISKYITVSNKTVGKVYLEGNNKLNCVSARHHPAATDEQSIGIIEAKGRYERLIKHEYGRHERWISTLESVSDKEKIILRRHFQQKKNVKPEILTAVLDRISSRLEKDEIKVAAERDKKSMDEYREYRRKYPGRTKPQQEDAGRRQYLISSQFVYMTEEEYAEHRARGKAREEEHFTL